MPLQTEIPLTPVTEGPYPLNGEQLRRLWERFTERISGFESFDAPGQLETEELAHKREALAKFRKAGGRDEVLRLALAGQASEALKLVQKASAGTVTFMNWRQAFGSTPATISKVLVAFHEVTKGAYAGPSMLQAIFAAADEARVTMTWDVLSAVLWVLRPDDFFPVKISHYRDLAKELGFTLPAGRPTPEAFHQVRLFAGAFRTALAPLRPTDWVHVQSFIWCVCPSTYTPSRRYWAGGFKWGEESKLEEFVQRNEWRIGWGSNDPDATAVRVWELLRRIRPGDEFAIKGYGGKHNLVVHYLGSVKSVDLDEGAVALEPLDRELYSGDAPRGRAAGNWQEALVEVKRRDVIQQVFFNEAPADSEITASPAPTPEPPNVPSITADPLNLILYGPPGTGKTHRVITEYLPRYESEAAKRTRAEIVDGLVEELALWEVLGLALLERERARVPELLASDLVIAKLAAVPKGSRGPRLWAALQGRTVRECPDVAYEQRADPLVFWKDAESRWSIDRVRVSKDAPQLLQRLDELQGKARTKTKGQRYAFVTFHPSYGYEEFVEGIRARTEEGQITYEVEPGVFKRMVERAVRDPEHRYAVFIDEINRANVAKVLGELMTLLEPSKRLKWNAERKEWEGLRIRLASSSLRDEDSEGFGVPANLDVIATMNTADRSIALLDTALRRRFTFEEIAPDPQELAAAQCPVVEKDGVQVELAKLLEALNDRLEQLYDRDHLIGHAYFMNVCGYEELEDVFLEQILPLLQEYFHDDWEKIRLVLGEARASTADGVQPMPAEAIVQVRQLRHVKGLLVDGEAPRVSYGWPASIPPRALRRIYDPEA